MKRDLVSLTIWAEQGVRVTSARPLNIAVGRGYLNVMRCLVQQMGADVSQILHGDTALIIATESNNPDAAKCLVMELGADINQGGIYGVTPLIVAARDGKLYAIDYLVALGAEVGKVDDWGETALLTSAREGHYSTMQYLLEEAGANMDDVNNDGDTVWDLLREHLEPALEDEDDENLFGGEESPAALAGLLRVLVLRAAPPPALVALLSPEPARVVQEGARLRARLPAYLAHRRAYLDLRCPRISLLPGVLRALIHGFEGPATTEELWATGLGAVP
jgi:hypothetical protein